MGTAEIRLYQPKDREGLFKIAGDTAFFGAPIEAYLEDRRIFLDSFYRYYTDYEPEHCWVAVDGEKVAGFITGCTNTLRSEQITREQLVPDVVRKFLRGYYRIGKNDFRYVWRLWLSSRRQEVTEVSLEQYPAHLHINVDSNYRGQGLGRRLLDVYLNQLRSLHNPGVHLGTTSENVAACRLYENMGFQLLDERETRIWEGIIDHPVYNREYGMRLK